MPIKPSGQISLQEIASEYRDPVPHDVSSLAGLTDGLTAGAQTGFNDFYGRSSAFSGPTYNSRHAVSVYFNSVDRDVYWAIDLRSMGSRWWSHNSDFNWYGFSFSDSNLPGLVDPSLYSSVAIDVNGSSGRYSVSVHQQPTLQNGWIGIVRADDNPVGSRGDYVLRINVTTTGAAPIFTQPNLWFNKTGMRVDPFASSGQPGHQGSSTTVTALYHPRVSLQSISWTGAPGFTLTNTNSATVTITNPNIWSEGAYQFGTYNIRGSTLTCNAVLRYNGIDYSVSKNIYVHAWILDPPPSGGDGG